MSVIAQIVPIVQSSDVSTVKRTLMDSLSGSPFDFIPRINVEADKRLFVERLVREMPAVNDLRFIVRLPNGCDIAFFGEMLAWDSRFFDYGVARIESVLSIDRHHEASSLDYNSAMRIYLEEAAQRNIKYLFATVGTRDLAMLRILGEAGFVLIETRLYYHRELEDYEYKERYDVRAAVASDVHPLACAARDTVNPYDRFHADPFIRQGDADRLMCRWVEASILEGFADITIVPNVPEPQAFCTVRYHKDNWTPWGVRLAQPVFGAVAPEFKGWYRKIISEVTYHLKDIGAQHAYLATQLTNSAVVHVWESLGYRFGKGEHILRKLA